MYSSKSTLTHPRESRAAVAIISSSFYMNSVPALAQVNSLQSWPWSATDWKYKIRLQTTAYCEKSIIELYISVWNYCLWYWECSFIFSAQIPRSLNCHTTLNIQVMKWFKWTLQRSKDHALKTANRKVLYKD